MEKIENRISISTFVNNESSVLIFSVASVFEDVVVVLASIVGEMVGKDDDRVVPSRGVLGTLERISFYGKCVHFFFVSVTNQVGPSLLNMNVFINVNDIPFCS